MARLGLAAVGSGRGGVARGDVYPRERAVQDPSRLGSGWEGGAVLLITTILVSVGLVMVYSASAVMAQAHGLAPHYYLLRQMSGAVVGILALASAATLDYRSLRVLAWPILAVSVGMLTLLVLPGTGSITPASNGARRWLLLGPVGIQPSEVAKLALLIWTAALVVKKQDRLRSLSEGLLPFLLIWGLTAGLILMQPDLSTAILTLLLVALVAYAGGARPAHFAALALVSLPSGGIIGRGFGEGQQKFGFLPEPHNDFIIAMIGEEWGFLGVAGLTVLFIAFALIGYRIARGAADLFGFLLAVGMTNLIVVQAFLHMAVNMALVPPTGLTLPFISYGRSSLIVSLAAVGVLMSVARISDRRDRALARAREDA
ncbi:MAG: putative peptidoglycan glycosyltransferase FtsW [Gemmatimonadota bacterium]